MTLCQVPGDSTPPNGASPISPSVRKNAMARKSPPYPPHIAYGETTKIAWFNVGVGHFRNDSVRPEALDLWVDCVTHS